MKKKTLFIILVLFLIFSFNIIRIHSLNVDSNVTGGEIKTSTTCESSICANTIGISSNVPNQPIDGIKVILMGPDNKSKGSANLWFTQAKEAVAESLAINIFNGELSHHGDSWNEYTSSAFNSALNNSSNNNNNNNIQAIFNKYNTKSAYEVFDYANFLKNISNNKDTDTVTTLLKAINSSYTINNCKDCYLVIEPIFILRYLAYTRTYYFIGTPKQIVDKLNGFKYFSVDGADSAGATVHKVWAKYFAHKDGPKALEQSEKDINTGKIHTSSGGTYGNWFVIANYFTALKLATPFGPFTNQGGNYSYEWASNYDSNIFGKGILNISDFLKTGYLKLYKRKTGTSTNITSASVTIGFYNNSSCSGSSYRNVTFRGQSDSIELEEGTYYIREDVKPSQYYIGDSTCHTVVIRAGETTPKVIYNTPTCHSDFAELIAAGEQYNIRKRLEMLAKYPTQYQLLNFSADTPEEACLPTRNCGITTQYTCDGIEVNYTGFDSNDLSCYIPGISTIKDVGEKTYCIAEFKFDTSVLRNFTTSPLKAGKLLYIGSKLPTLSFVKTCYSFDGLEIKESVRTFNLNHYITGYKINGLSRNGDELSVISYDPSSPSVGASQIFTLTRKACISKLSGKEVDLSNCNETYSEEYFEGKYLYKEALVPKFTLEGEVYVYPSLEFTDVKGYKSTLERDLQNEGKSLTIQDSDKCVFNFEREIIPPGTDTKLNLIFRIIDINNPFPGRDAIGRVIGSNWCDGESPCVIADSNYVQSEIKEAKNSLGTQIIDGAVVSAKPEYKITLDRELIREIRQYNKEHSYDEYNVDLVGREYKNSFLNQIKDSFEVFEGIEQ